MKFIKSKTNPTSTILIKNNRYAIRRLSDSQLAFSSKRPRKNSKYWSKKKYFIWDLINDCPA